MVATSRICAPLSTDSGRGGVPGAGEGVVPGHRPACPGPGISRWTMRFEGESARVVHPMRYAAILDAG